MQEYSFEPDYAAWWKKKDLTVEQACWLTMGISPDKGEEAKERWRENDLGYIKEIIDNNPKGETPDYHTVQEVLKCLSLYETIDKKNTKDKVSFIKARYHHHDALPEKFIDALEKSCDFHRDLSLEKYREHQMFKHTYADVPIGSIKTEKDAFALLLGVEPKSFYKFFDLATQQKNGPRSKEGFTPLVYFSPQDIWFYIEYQSFWEEEYQSGAPYSLAVLAWEKAKELKLWEGNFVQYAQRLHNEGFIFKRDIVSWLETQGIILEYEKESWPMRFYKNWLKKGGWSIQEAIYLFKGQSPEKKGRSFIDLSQNPYVLNLGVNKSIYSWGANPDELERLDKVLERHKAMGKLQAHPIGEEELFEPEEIVKWLLEQTNYIPPKALLKVCEKEETPEQEKERALASVKASEAQKHKEVINLGVMRKQDRDELIMDYAVELWEENPSSRIGEIKNLIKKSERFVFGERSPDTVLKPITDEAISQKRASRRNAENRGKNTF